MIKRFWSDFKGFVCNWRFIVPLLAAVSVGYGFMLTHFAIGLDDLTRPRYLQSEMIAQGRFSGNILCYMFGLTEYRPVWEDLLSVIFMILAAIVAAIYLKRLTNGGWSGHVYTFFGCYLATFPLLNEIFLYAGAGLNMGVGYGLTFASLMAMERFFRSDNSKLKKASGIILCILFLIFNVSLYESFVFAYICAVCGTLMIKQLAEQDRPIKKIFAEIGWYIVPLAAGVVLEYLISTAIRLIAGLKASSTGAAEIVFPPNVFEAVADCVIKFFLNGLFYLPITVLVASGVILLAQTVKQSAKNKKHIYWLFAAGMVLSVLALPILQSGNIKYRTSQVIVVFCMFPLAILLQNLLTKKKLWVRVTALVAAGVLIAGQSFDLCRWFYADYRQSEEEKTVMLAVGDELAENYNVENKPVVFAGEYSLSEEVLDFKYAKKSDFRYKLLNGLCKLVGHDLSLDTPNTERYGFPVAQTQHGSVITWGVDAFDEVNTELLRIYDYYGYEFKQGNEAQLERAEALAKEFAQREAMEDGRYLIVEENDCIFVVFR